jgi:O-antigen/teichoic acid export membrane protein
VLQLVSRLLSLPLALVTLSLATHYLGEHGYGVLTTAVVFAGLFDTFTELGIGTIIVRRVTAGEGSLSRLVGMNVALSTVYAIPLALVAGAAGLLVYNGEPTTQLAVLIVCARLIFTTLASCFEPVFDVHLRYEAVAASELGSRIVTLAVTALVVLTDAGLIMMCAVQILPQLVRMVVTGLAAHRMAGARPVLDPGATLRLVRESLPITLMIAIGVFYWRADGVLLSVLSNPAEVGAYGLALQLTSTFSLIPQVFCRSTLSTISKSFATDPIRFRAAMEKGYRFLLLCAAPVAILGWPLAERLVALVGSAAFIDRTTPVLQLFFVAVAVSFLNPLISDALIAGRQERFLTTLSATNLVLNIGLNAALIPMLGAVGTGIALITTHAAGVLVSQIRLRRIGVGLVPVGYLLRLVPALTLALGALWLTWKLPLVVPLAAAGIAYTLGTVAAGAVPPTMRSSLWAAVRRPQDAPPTG